MATALKSGSHSNRYNKAKLKQGKECGKTKGTACKQSNNSNNNNNKQHSVDYLHSGGYDTLDSAYGTGESSYNTVDSTYIQQSSGYSTLDLKWRQPKLDHDLGSTSHRGSYEFKSDAPLDCGPTYSSDLAIQSDIFRTKHPEFDEFKYVDDVDPNDSDTATDTETDTELTLDDMSYIPDYVRPVASPISVMTFTSTTASLVTSRPVITSTMTSPSVSVSSSNMTSPANSVKDENISPRAMTYKRNERNKSYLGYREDYVRKQKEKLSGRKSLDERLKSLESEASVKLQVRKGSQYRQYRQRRWTTGRDGIQLMGRSWENRPLPSDPAAKHSSSDNILKELGSALEDIKNESTASKQAPPDIIEAHQPASHNLSQVSSQDDEGDDDVDVMSYKREASKQSVEIKEGDGQESNSDTSFHKIDSNIEESMNFFNCSTPEKRPQSPPHLHSPLNSTNSSVLSSEEASLISENNTEPNTSNSEICSPPTFIQDVASPPPTFIQHVASPPPTFIQDVASPTPPIPSVNLPTFSFDEPIQNDSKTVESLESIRPPNHDQQIKSDQTNIPDEKNTTQSTQKVIRRDGPVQRRNTPAPITLDITTANNTVIPVELRSPRSEGVGGFGRANMREKRNARVFMLPSSDDSENDILLARFNRSSENSLNRSSHVTPVKFVPSAVRRSRSRSQREDLASQSSSTSSIAADSKATSPEERKTPVTMATKSPEKSTKTSQAPRRKLSRSPKRSDAQRSYRSKSTHDRPSKERNATRSRRGSHSPISITNDENDGRFQQSSEMKDRSSRSLKGKSSKGSSRARSKTAGYSELTNIKRTTSKGKRNTTDDTALPSPRQLAVAHAVKFGFPGNEGVIPFIDEAGSPNENRKKNMNTINAHLSSEDALLHHIADAETCRRALPLSGRGRPSKMLDGPRRSSYLEAMESSDDVTPDPDTDGSIYGVVRTESGRERQVPLNKYGRSNSADSILSTNEPSVNVVLRNHTRSSSADRNSLKGVHRRSYQIATSFADKKEEDPNTLLRTTPHKRQASIRKLKNFFAEGTTHNMENQTDEARRGLRGRSLAPQPTLDLNDYDDTVIREGFLNFKVATIEKGKRTSSQKSWKLVWVVLKEQSLYLCKDWSRYKQDNSVPGGGSGASNLSGGGANQPPSQLLLEEDEPLNIQGSLVSIAYNYVKRRNVFKVTTSVGSEYLLQAEDRDDMLAWITSIQVSGNHDNKDGHVTINEDLILRKSNQIESGHSDPTRHKLRTEAVNAPESSRSLLGPLPYHLNALRRQSVKPSSKLNHRHIATQAISCPKPLDLHGLPNGLCDIENPKLNTVQVTRRIKEGSPKKAEELKKNRRKGIVLSETSPTNSIVISGPVHISSSPGPNHDNHAPVNKQRSPEEQQALLEELVNSQKPVINTPLAEIDRNKKSKKPKSRVESLNDLPPRPRASSGGRMADKIQRTIRALYDGNSGKSLSTEKLEEYGSDDDSLKLKPVHLGSRMDSSPKQDKRMTRKSRSPKPVRRLMAVPAKDMDGSRRFKWRGSVNRIVRKFGQGQTLMQGGTFDIHLEDCPASPNNELIPFVVELCCRVVEERGGLTFTGIYRVPGNNGTLSALQEELNIRGAEAMDLENDERFCELNVVSSLLKSFFRKLPDPLFTNELYDNFIAMNRKKDMDERLQGLRRLIHMLPAPHYETLKFLTCHLRRVADNCETNKMEVRNLAIVFGPTLVRSTASDNMATMVTDMSDQCRIVESILQHASWFFSGDELKGFRARKPLPSAEAPIEPVPNIDHLLPIVGRMPGDTSDTASESSKSKTSVASERESFSRDVIDMVFGAEKKWNHDHQSDIKGHEASGKDYGSKETQQHRVRITGERMTPIIPPKSPVCTAPPTRYQVAVPAASGIRAGWPAQGQHLPHDIPARLYDFYVENLERLTQTDASRPLPNFSSSSNDTSPQVTPRSSLFDSPGLQRSYLAQVKRSSSTGLQNGESKDVHHHQPSLTPQVTLKPLLYGDSPQNIRYCKNPDERNPTLVTSSRLNKSGDTKLPSAQTCNQSESSLISKEAFHGGNESDSDMSVYVGETFEEKLKNLTNLDKKLERRPSRRHSNPYSNLPSRVPLSPANPIPKRLSAPSLERGEALAPVYAGKKSTRELYQERKAQRRHLHHGMLKARTSFNESDLTRCASDENVFVRDDPKRLVIRSVSRTAAAKSIQASRRLPKDRIRRRHTLGGSDIPADFWENVIYTSLQNISRGDPGSAMARLRPKLGPIDSIVPTLTTNRLITGGGSWRADKSKKTESYI